MAPYKVVIPCAGTGSRIAPYTKAVNKALVTLGDLPAIVRIILQFPQETELVIPLGYKANHLRQVLDTFFPDRVITYVDIDLYEGKGSGLGYTLNKVKHLLQCPFVFCPNDSLIKFDDFNPDPNLLGNWLAIYKKRVGDEVPVDQYRTISVSNGFMVNINPKGIYDSNVYTGLCGVRNYEEFWEKMSDEESAIVGESFGLKALDRVRVFTFEMWWDTGNLLSIKRAKEYYNNKENNILEKENEAIWFYNSKVIKFHTDKNFILDRLSRSKEINSSLIPEIMGFSDNLFWYKEVDGKVFSQVIDNDKTVNLLNHAQSLMWSKTREFNLAKDKGPLSEFYKEKTILRVQDYLKRFEKDDMPLKINSLHCPKITELISSIDWEEFIQDSIISQFHGDFHSENILYTEDNFKLIDWRQDFGELGKKYGDVYYDLAKFLHGLMVSHEIIANDGYSINYLGKDEVLISFDQKFSNVQAIDVFYGWCKENSYSIDKIKLITALIYLNISSLHHYPYSDLLFLLGKYMLTQTLQLSTKYKR